MESHHLVTLPPCSPRPPAWGGHSDEAAEEPSPRHPRRDTNDPFVSMMHRMRENSPQSTHFGEWPGCFQPKGSGFDSSVCSAVSSYSDGLI
ncbi:unnamed protein product [Merluccius merluccius]